MDTESWALKNEGLQNEGSRNEGLQDEELRIVSLIPSATEIVAALGYGDRLVGRSHECDYPASVTTLPICTEPKFDPVGSSAQVHQRVSDLLTSALSVYRVKTEVLAQLRPTHVITQAQCEVCAVSLADVKRAVVDLVGGDRATRGQAIQNPAIQVISLQPERLADVWTDMATVAEALGKGAEETAGAIANLKKRLPNVASSPSRARLKVACIEWTEPLMAAGNWVPELVDLAGGLDCLGKAGAHSAWMSWADLAAADPDIIIVLPCGYDLAQTRQATEEMAAQPQWPELRAVKKGAVYLADGNQYFNRPGPRLVESCQILSEIIQQRSPDPTRLSVGWERWRR